MPSPSIAVLRVPFLAALDILSLAVYDDTRYDDASRRPWFPKRPTPGDNKKEVKGYCKSNVEEKVIRTSGWVR